MALCLRARLWQYLLHGQGFNSRFIHGPPNLPLPPLVDSVTPEHEKEARSWLSSFRAAATIPKHLAELSFSRSSGPGGQNVNKLSTKVTARCRVDAPWIPPWARENLMRSPYYVKSSHSLLMTSSASRSQASNVDDVLSKLHALVAESAAKLITNSPTVEQRQRVASFQKADGARRRMQKDKRSVIKKSRSSKHWD
ncbi:hypothetical protein PAXINDRAFT_135038 [Paxillus involutus ATCC 200175]|uniref:Prokaryotic-type class I peptide chain release factors domain-containing protein n=1 Tax=Paxillus involutus ATCC 200175 TaxID=664439 RepID=A0A0C9SXG6_PAXIN|nr:hypothetical protein PAXINDRAFT_135038 [Paxillus involutus ATCC 200175]